jgi:hypothetical protein
MNVCVFIVCLYCPVGRQQLYEGLMSPRNRTDETQKRPRPNNGLYRHYNATSERYHVGTAQIVLFTSIYTYFYGSILNSEIKQFLVSVGTNCRA